MNLPATCIAALVIATASSSAKAADVCTFDMTGTGGIVSRWTQQVNPEYWIKEHPECYNPDAVNSAGLDSLTRGTRTSASTLPRRCVIPASAVPFLGPCVGSLCAQVWEDVIICDKNGGRLTVGGTPQGTACPRSHVNQYGGQDVVCPAKPRSSSGYVTHECSGKWSYCMKLDSDLHDNGNGVWINVAGPHPPSKNPAVHELTRENLTNCDGDHDYGSSYSFFSREDICSGMGLDHGKIFRQCTKRPCPSIAGALWPNGKLRCNQVSDGGWMGTCLSGGRCQYDERGIVHGSKCHDGGPDVDLRTGKLEPAGRPYTPPNYSLTGTRYPDGGSLAATRRTPAATPAPTHTPADDVPDGTPTETSGESSGSSAAPTAPSAPKRLSALPRARAPKTLPDANVASPPAEDAESDGPLPDQPPTDDPQ